MRRGPRAWRSVGSATIGSSPDAPTSMASSCSAPIRAHRRSEAVQCLTAIAVHYAIFTGMVASLNRLLSEPARGSSRYLVKACYDERIGGIPRGAPLLSRPDSADHKPKRGTDRPTSFAHDYIRNARSKCARRGANETYRHFVAGLLP